MPTPQGTWWCFTLNNPGEYRPAFDKHIAQYLCYQLEQGSKGTPHLQGVVQFLDRKTTFRKAKLAIGDKAHLEPMRAKDPQDAINYCKKEEGRLEGPWEYGEYLKKGSHKRKRARIEEEYDADPEDFKIRDPDTANRILSKRMMTDFVQSSDVCLEGLNRPWQVRLKDELKQAPDRRTIHWVVGEKGGEGKSTFADALVKEGWAVVRSRPLPDMMYQYVDQGLDKNLVVDISRRFEASHYDGIYQLIEDVKDRTISSTKYRPIFAKIRGFVHVVVMTNKDYDPSKISEDRICLHRV